MYAGYTVAAKNPFCKGMSSVEKLLSRRVSDGFVCWACGTRRTTE